MLTSPGDQFFVSLIESALGRFLPKVHVGTQYLKQQLTARAVRVHVSDGCVEDFVRSAMEAVAAHRKPESPYLDCFRRELDSRVRFILEWTGSDVSFDPAEYADCIRIARRFALPRPWKCVEPWLPSNSKAPKPELSPII